MKVSIVGPIKKNAKQGKTNPKIFIYQEALEVLGYQTRLFSVSLPKYKIFSLIKNLVNSLKYGETILLMLGGGASRTLTGLILFLNKFYKKRLVLCPFGTGPLNKLLKDKNSEFVDAFLTQNKYGRIKDKRMESKLKKLDCVVVQNDVLKNCFENFYKLKNVVVLKNFRSKSATDSTFEKNSIIYISRVNEEKGILDLMEVINKHNSDSDKSNNIKLDIYGENHLENKSLETFNSLLDENIKYFGTVPNEEVQMIISRHAISCLPTKYNGEGTPGFLIESLIAGVPIVVSSFSQVSSIVENGFDSIVFKMGDKKSLLQAILKMLSNEDLLSTFRKNASTSGHKYIFENNIETIQKIIEG